MLADDTVGDAVAAAIKCNIFEKHFYETSISCFRWKNTRCEQAEILFITLKDIARPKVFADRIINDDNQSNF